MKVVLSLILLLASANLAAQTKKVILLGDSLIIKDENITTNSFNFGRDPLTHLRSKVKLPKPGIEITTVENNHVANQMDTIYAIKFRTDLFSVYKVGGDGQNFLISAEVRTKRFTTKHGIKVGMNKSQIKTLLKGYNIQSIPKYLVLENLENPEYLRLEFKKDILKAIRFQGYFD